MLEKPIISKKLPQTNNTIHQKIYSKEKE